MHRAVAVAPHEATSRVSGSDAFAVWIASITAGQSRTTP